ncbi:MAG TPA: PAS domain S-box protein [Terriglobales bacterium]|nr:PAS domain S-box protein [Terriglobales bacterium]
MSDTNLIGNRVVTPSIFKNVERREWVLWSSAVIITLVLTLGLVSFLVPSAHASRFETEGPRVVGVVRGLICLVLLFDIYVVYQQLQICRIRRQLVEREELFRLITENAADMIAVVDSKGNRLYNSPAYASVLGYSLSDLQKTTAFEHIHPEDCERVEAAAKETIRVGVGRGIEYRMRHKDGSWRVLESTANAVLDPEGKVEKLVIVNRDITDRRRLEDQFRQAQKMEAVGRLSGGIAHDFNNLLGVIIGYAEILQEQLGETKPFADSIQEILKAGNRASALTRQLLAFSRQQVLEPRVLDLNVSIADTEKMLKRIIGEDIELSTILDTNLSRIKADKGQIEQVLLNLCVNARDAMPSGGKLVVETRNYEMDENAVRGYSYPVKTGAYVLLTVSDSGIGMDSATQAHIFEPFFTTKGEGQGTGLGLATVYGIVKQSGGYIDVASEIGNGATFKIYLPAVEEEINQEIRNSKSIPSAQRRETVLVIEDEAALRKLTCTSLRHLGYTVLEAACATEAVTVSRELEGEIDLMLTDIVMPGMNGRDLVKHLSAERPSMKVVYMSGYTGQSIGNAESFAPDAHFLPKPFTREALGEKLQEALAAGVGAQAFSKISPPTQERYS